MQISIMYKIRNKNISLSLDKISHILFSEIFFEKYLKEITDRLKKICSLPYRFEGIMSVFFFRKRNIASFNNG